MTGGGPGEGAPGEGGLGQDAAAHLQRAALELIAAARAILDVAEEAVREPGGVAAIVTDTLGAFMTAAKPAPPASDAAERPPGVEHIRIT